MVPISVSQRIFALGVLCYLCSTSVACGRGGGSPFPVITLSPTTASLSTGQTLQLTATVTSAADRTITWQVNGKTGGSMSSGFITPAGLYSAPIQVPNPSTVTISAISNQDTSVIATSLVTVTSNTSVLVSPSGSTIPARGLQQFAFTVNGAAPPPGTAANWQVDGLSGGDAIHGAIDTFGAYTAPANPPPGGIVTISVVDPRGAGTGSASARIGLSVAMINGAYAFSYTGQNAGSFVIGNKAGFVVAGGILNAAGSGLSGNVSGTMDLNGPNGFLQNASFTGTYTVGIDGRGTMTLNFLNPFQTLTWQIAVLNTNSVLFIDSTSGISTASGSMELQDPIAFNTAALAGNFVVSLSGLSRSTGLLEEAGLLTFDGSGNVSPGMLDLNDAGSIQIAQPATGTYSVTGTGQGSLALSSPSGTQNLFVYVIDADRAKLLEVDSVPRIVGELTRQAKGPFSDSSLNGNYTFEARGVATGLGQLAAGGLVTLDGNGGVTAATGDQNIAGSVYQGQSLANGSYTVDVSGRSTLDLNFTSGPALHYSLYPKADGTLSMLDLSSSSVSSGNTYPQTGIGNEIPIGGFAINWNGAAFSSSASTFVEEDISGQMTVGDVGTLSAKLDTNVRSKTGSASITGFYTLDPGGRRGLVTSSNFNLIIYPVDTNTVLILDTSQTRVLTGAIRRQF